MTTLLLFILYAVGLSIGLARSGCRRNVPRPADAPTEVPERVLIVGATGGTGRELVAQALERGLTVTALVRDPSKLQVSHPRLTVIQGDVLEADSLEVAVRDQEAILCALGHKRWFYPTRILSEGTSNILRAMESHGIRRFICETALGIGNSAGRMGLYYTLVVIPLILPLYFWDKARQERIVAESSLDWAIVRPGALTNGPKRDRLRHGRDVGSFLWTVRASRADVAGFMLDQLGSNKYLRTPVGVA